jgi:putative ATP-dependent endonuclease of OLD family
VEDTNAFTLLQEEKDLTEYDLAFCGLAEEVYVAACLAVYDDSILEGDRVRADVEADARAAFERLEKESDGDRAVLCARIYRLFHSGGASKAIAAQYLAEALDATGRASHFDRTAFAA